ncbi:MAG: class I SAM-dependent methyltransferase [Candidatus Pacebacteria bacterium]|nr:class I SAM-dependent methyltransferase [Candidatus Paceibacterota bacterium]
MIKDKLYFLLSPDFIERESIRKSLLEILRDYGSQFSRKNLLDIGCGSQPYKKYFINKKIKYFGIDFYDYSKNHAFPISKPDYFFKKQYPKDFFLSQFKDNTFDIISAFQVLEHHEKPSKFFSEARRILKNRGYMILSFPFIWQLHEEPRDYQRFTHFKIEKFALEYGFEIIKIKKRGSTFSTVSQILSLSFQEIKIPRLIKTFISIILFTPLEYISIVYDHLINNEDKKIFLGYSILLRKI